jgi:hypothetical protein
MEGWPSGLRRTPGKRVGSNVSGVQIPFLPPSILALLSFPQSQRLASYSLNLFEHPNFNPKKIRGSYTQT